MKSLVKQANQLYRKYFKQIIPHFFFVGYISLLAQYLHNGIFSFLVAIFLCSIVHGYAKCAMKVVDESEPTLTLNDSLIGIKQFIRYFPTYFVRKLITIIVVIIIILPISLNYTINIPMFTLEWLDYVANNLIQMELFVLDMDLFVPLFQNIGLIVNLISGIIAFVIMTILYNFIPYILEEDEYSWMEAMSKSFYLVKNNFRKIFRFYMFYLLPLVIYIVWSGIIYSFMFSGNDIMMLLGLVVLLFAYILIFKGRFEIGKYLLYKEVKEDE